ncbi:MAG: replication initiator protein [Microviridae sp.]|nr:MAG: replication initiator protein [Microviridae sp.]
MHSVSCMLNLTYEDAWLPEHGQLWKDDLQRFFKRLRKAGFKFRYVASGEYGEKNRRPHFHIALFGVDFSGDRRVFGRSNTGDRTFVSDAVSRAWHKGNHLICTLNFETAAYIARYIMKKAKGTHVAEPLAVLDDGEIIRPNPEFLIMSKGIGKSWFREFFMSDVFPRASVITSKGSSAPVPRYYKTLLKEVGADLALDMQFRSTARADMDLERNAFENLPHRKVARKTVSDSRLSLSKRSL